MAISASMLPEFDHEMTTTRTCLQRLAGADFAWKPHDKSMSMGQLANHIGEIPHWLTSTLTIDSLDLAPVGGEAWKPMAHDSVDEILAAFDGFCAEARGHLESATDPQMLAQWSLLMAGESIFAMPRVAAIRTMVLNHLYHHRGQLTVYMRLNGILVPAIYGPSADEQG